MSLFVVTKTVTRQEMFLDVRSKRYPKDNENCNN